MGDLLKIPDKKTKNSDSPDRSDGKQVLLSLIAVCIVVVAVTTHEGVVKKGLSEKVIAGNASENSNGRMVASVEAEPNAADFQSDRIHEAKLLEKLKTKNNEQGSIRRPSSVGEKPSLLADLKYGLLAGKYQLATTQVNEAIVVKSIEYVRSAEVSEKPLFVARGEFFEKYQELIGVKFERFQRKDQREIASVRKEHDVQFVETWILQGPAKTQVGEVNFYLDTEGRLVKAEFP